MSLRVRVLLGMTVIAAMVLFTAVVTTRLTERRLVEQIDDRLATASPAIDRGLPGLGGRIPPPDAARDDLRFSAFFVGVLAADSDTIETVAEPVLSGDALAAPDLDAATARSLAGDRDATPVTVGTDGDLEYRLVVRSTRGGDLVVVAAPLDEVAAAVAQIRGITLSIAAIVLLTLALVAWWVLHLGVRPVQRMTATARAIADDDLSRRVEVGARRTEAGELGLALNSMLDRLETAFDERARTEERLRRFVGDASHELRTPVQTIRGYAEMYRMGALGDTSELDDAMRRTEQEAVRMAALVEELLTLARFDQARPLQHEAVDLAQLARDAGADAAAVQPERPIRVETPDHAIVDGDEYHLRQVLANVVGNAIVHTPATAAVSISVVPDPDAGEVVVAVHADGPGMPAELADRAFERFARADPSRSRHAGGSGVGGSGVGGSGGGGAGVGGAGVGGSGLGLAIALAAVDAHGGTVTLETAEGRGTTVSIRLPVAPDTPDEERTRR